MTVRRFINDKRDYFSLLSMTYLFVLVLFSIIGDRGLLTSLSLFGEKRQLETNIGLLESQIQSLEQDVYDYTFNDRAIYEYAREVLNMRQDNEIQFVFKESHP